MDTRLFAMEKSKYRGARAGVNNGPGGQTASTTKSANSALLIGKTRQFPISRIIAIVQYLTAIELSGTDEPNAIPAADEYKLINQSADFYAAINTLVSEGLLRRVSMRVGVQMVSNASSATDDFVNVGFKCNFDNNFIYEVAEKIDFQLSEFLFTTSVHDEID